MNTLAYVLLAVAIFAINQKNFAEASPFDDGPERIINGEIAKEGQFPYLASLRWWIRPRGSSNFDFYHFCGASVINKRWVVTAAHCLQAIKPQDRVVIVVGTNHVSKGGDRYPKKRYIIHPKFDENLNNDIGLMESTKDFIFNDRVQPIALNRGPVPGGQTGLLSGWGDVKDDVSRLHLLYRNAFRFSSLLLFLSA